MKLYVNGVQLTAFSSSTYPTSGFQGYINNTVAHGISARQRSGFDYYLDGYQTEVNFLDGYAYDPSYFGYSDPTTGVWMPKKYQGAYGTNGFYLTFQDNSAATAAAIGKDWSGVNTNNWTPNNISVTSGVTYDSMLDVPTNWADGGNGRGNYAVLNPLNLWQSSGTTSVVSGNLNQSTSTGSATGGAAATIAISSGKFYWETEFNAIPSSNTCGAGLYDTSVVFGGANSWARSGHWILGDSGLFYANGAAGSASGTGAFSAGNIAMFAFDGSTGKLWVGKNGTWVGTPGTSGEIATLTMSGKSYAPITSTYSTGSIVIANFGQRPFTYTPPSGFKALNTNNIPTPTILNGANYMAATTYTGTGSALSISNQTNSGNNPLQVPMQPDFVWIKGRSSAYSHALFDSVRGALKLLISNSTGAEVTETAGTSLTGFSSNGFALGTNGGSASTNVNSQTFIGWQWQAGKGSSSIPSGGTITPTGASINTTAGFSVITYTGTLTGTPGTCPTVGHGLGVAPSLVISRSRNVTGVDSGAWFVWSANTGSTDNYLRLNTTAAVASVTGGGGGTMVAPTSTVFSTPYISGSNINANNYIAYCWTAIPGFSAFGGFTGNGTTGDGAFIFTGFAPRFILYKRTDQTSSWFIQDTSRQSYNVQGPELYPDSSAVEATATRLDFLSNGFKVRAAAATNPNVSTATYIYAAFAENPFKVSRAK
jgi:hypothetical protein